MFIATMLWGEKLFEKLLCFSEFGLQCCAVKKKSIIYLKWGSIMIDIFDTPA